MASLVNPRGPAAVEAVSGDNALASKSPELASFPDSTATSSIIVVNLPEQVTAKETKHLLRDLREQLISHQPCVVLDMSDVREMDSKGIDLLLKCLAETLRRDGIIRVRGVSPEAATVLELTGMDQILGLGPEAVSQTEESAAADCRAGRGWNSRPREGCLGCEAL
jgi:anti-anti-sigma factor